MPSGVPPKLTGHASVHAQSEAGEQAGCGTSGDDPAAVALPTEEVVRTWDSEDLYKWLTSITPPPLSEDKQTTQAFLDTKIDGPVFLDWNNKLFSDDIAQVIPFGVARRLNMLANSIKDNDLRTTASRKRAASNSSAQYPKGKKLSLTGSLGANMPVTQASGGALIMKGSPRLVEDLAEANHAVVHKLVGMYLAS